MEKHRLQIAKAIETTQRVVPGHFEKTVAQRAQLDKMSAGSVVENVTASQLEQMLRAAEWEEYSHDAVMPGCHAFKTQDIVGRLGVVPLSQLSDDIVVTLDDRKDTGKVSCIVKGALGPKVDFTVIILGEEQGEEIVYTFHPGDPVNPSKIPMKIGMDGRQVTVKEALSLGLEIAKIG